MRTYISYYHPPFPPCTSFSWHFRDARSMQVVLADKYDSYRMTYEGCHVFNPGRFIGRSLGFSTYTPASRESEAWYVCIYLIYLSPFLFLSRFTRLALGTEQRRL